MNVTKETPGGVAGKQRPKVIISGGGTGGHIFPALSIAEELRKRMDAEILFVGAAGRMEMTRVPEAGYKIIGLPVAGFDRKRPWKNVAVIAKLLKSMTMARKILKDFKPEIVIGVGGYASGPMLKEAQKRGIPTLIQEQNSYAGVTNKLLAKKADSICVAYDGMERFFPAEVIVKTGNPIRRNLLDSTKSRKEAAESFGLSPDRKILLVVGGSLGALTINESLEKGIKSLASKGVQVIWQTGRNFGNRGPEAVKGLKGVVVTQFISDMASAYRAADLVVSRAGAASISELQALGKPAILVPSPNVAEDHQTHNAMALVNKGAAVLVKDAEARDKLVDEAINLISDPEKLESMSAQISKMGIIDSDRRIGDEVKKILGNKNGKSSK
ncbi:MAG: undecaprenyldiphospho-muramoylpentapeptide beta-N-acetylglucosaminyltransferase [Muribaculaceae bacterium]|nr:undecaprenyldiphospho-muramoylpentapeptide beta-N-acetylglucosaminyltransferase [Muribaculaceae bacterium]